ncbi:hypothetical protein BX666DRAFT_1877711 [Dichotomocladium elegans]|nr:hypothetical protein BX666DRAFT_1877711 [Dichotomocladium elegans]
MSNCTFECRPVIPSKRPSDTNAIEPNVCNDLASLIYKSAHRWLLASPQYFELDDSTELLANKDWLHEPQVRFPSAQLESYPYATDSDADGTRPLPLPLPLPTPFNRLPLSLCLHLHLFLSRHRRHQTNESNDDEVTVIDLAIDTEDRRPNDTHSVPATEYASSIPGTRKLHMQSQYSHLTNLPRGLLRAMSDFNADDGHFYLPAAALNYLYSLCHEVFPCRLNTGQANDSIAANSFLEMICILRNTFFSILCRCRNFCVGTMLSDQTGQVAALTQMIRHYGDAVLQYF